MNNAVGDKTAVEHATGPMQGSHNSIGANPQAGSDEIDLGYLFAVCIDHKWLIFIVTLLCTLIGATYATFATPIYRADALLEVESRQNNLASLELAVMGQESGTAASTQMEILRSRMVLRQAAAQAGLDIVVQPNYMPVVGAALVRRGRERPGFAEGDDTVWAGERIAVAELNVDTNLLGEPIILRVTGPGRYTLYNEAGRALGSGEVEETLRIENPFITLRVDEMVAPTGASFHLIKRSETGMTNYLRSNFQVSERGRETGILELSISGPDRAELVRSLDAIAEVYLLQNIERQAAEAENRLAFLEEQAPQIRGELSGAEDRLNEYRASQQSVDLSFETRTMLERLVQIESALNQLQIEESALSERYTPSHPTYRTLIERREQLNAERVRLEAQVDDLPETQREVLRLNRDVEVTQQLYMQMLNAIQELRVTRAGTVGNVRIVDRAEAGSNPIAPRRNLVLVLSLVLGLMLGLMIVLLRHMLRRGVESVDQIEDAGLQVYATVPLSEQQMKLVQALRKGWQRFDPRRAARQRRRQQVAQGLLSWTDPADLAVEALRGLRTSLHFAMMDAANNCLMITGSSPGVGKSFVSVNLAAVCAQAGQKVLVVDADMRKGHIHKLFGHAAESGLSDMLVGDNRAVIRKTEDENLNYVARGTVPPNPSELLMSQRFKQFLDDAAAYYDLIIIDTPPALAVTDAAIVGKLCGSSLLVARFRQNTAKELQRTRSQLASAGVPVKGAILNAVERTATAYYGYGYGYYHYEYK